MAKRLTNRQRLAFKIESLSDPEITAVLEYINNIEERREPEHSNIDDELVASLADAPENRRAREVVEWEKVRRRADSQATPVQAIASYAGKF